MISAQAALVSLALAAAVVTPLQAATVYDFSANYDILSPSGEKIGTYTHAVKGPKDGVYELNGRIEFAIRAWGLFRRTYSSVDSVLYDADGIVRYEIEENDNGKRTRIAGGRSPDGSQLHFRQTPALVSPSSIPRASYDLSQYAFRFPLPCAQQTARELRILAPRTGRIETVRGEPVPVDDTMTTPAGEAGCRLLTRDAEGKLIKESWFLPDGTLAYEKTADFQLQLTGVHDGNK